MSDYSQTLMDHFQAPRQQGRMETPDCIGVAGIPGQGRCVQLFLRLAGDRLERMQFCATGCGVTIAACSVLTELAEGRTRSECEAIDHRDIITALAGIPPHKQDCAHFVVSAFQDALVSWRDSGTRNTLAGDRHGC